MLAAFFPLAAQSPQRQRGFRRAGVSHLAILVACLAWVSFQLGKHAALVSYVLLTAGIVEGAALVGWRLTQLPRSQALEFLLVSPLRPRRVFLAEALVGLARLGLVTLSGLPVLLLLVLSGCFEPIDLLPLLIMPFTWGAITGLGLTTWAYEPMAVRRWAERVMLALVVIYLAVGGLPVLTLGLPHFGWPALAALLPPGSVYCAVRHVSSPAWLIGTASAGVAALLVARRALAGCEAELRRWYDQHHGRKVLD